MYRATTLTWTMGCGWKTLQCQTFMWAEMWLTLPETWEEVSVVFRSSRLLWAFLRSNTSSTVDSLQTWLPLSVPRIMSTTMACVTRYWYLVIGLIIIISHSSSSWAVWHWRDHICWSWSGLHPFNWLRWRSIQVRVDVFWQKTSLRVCIENLLEVVWPGQVLGWSWRSRSQRCLEDKVLPPQNLTCITS